MLKKLVTVFIIIGFVSLAHAHEPKFSERTDILHIIQSYSDRTGVKFVTDPRVMARVNMIGLDIDEVSQTNLMDILLIHTFTAYERNGVVYVLPIIAADHLGIEAGELWGN